MRFTVHGFKQDKLIELGLDNDDALILRYFIDFRDTESMRAEVIEGETYYWIKYEAVIQAIPILKLKKKDSLYRKLKNMVTIGVLKHKTIKSNGTYSYFGIGSKYYELINETIGNKSEGYGNKSVGGTEINPRGYGNKSVPNNSSIIYSSIKDNNTSSDGTSDSRTPYKHIIDLFNATCKSLPKVMARNKARDKKIKNMYKELGLEKIEIVFSKAEASPFLSGRNGTWENCGFDWLISPKNYIKVLEGNYDDKTAIKEEKKPKKSNSDTPKIILKEDF